MNDYAKIGILANVTASVKSFVKNPKEAVHVEESKAYYLLNSRISWIRRSWRRWYKNQVYKLNCGKVLHYTLSTTISLSNSLANSEGVI